MNNIEKQAPYAHLITFRTYGTWLHGNAKLSVHHSSNKFGTPKIPFNEKLHSQMEDSLKIEALVLNAEQRDAVLSGISFACNKYEWRLFAAHVRSNHVHLVMYTPVEPNQSMNRIKSFATRFLRNIHLQRDNGTYWTRHGSIKPIWKPEFLLPAMRYVIDEQGERMSICYEKWYEEEKNEQ